MSTYISLDNLARYDMKAKARSKDTYADASAACWQKTEKAGAVTCWPSPETPLEPVVEFLFKETLPEGAKGPSNPSVIEGLSSVKVTRCGKNIIQYPFYETTRTRNGITFTDNGDGTITANGTATDYTQFALINPYWNQNGGKLLPVGTYRLSGCPAGGNWNTYKLRVVFSSIYSDYVTAPSDTGSGSTVAVTKASVVSWMIEISSGTTVSNLVFKPQLELGTTATAFEPYAGADYAISLPSTFYGGTLDVASGKLTVTHRMVEPSSGTVDISDRPALLPLEYADTYGRTVTSDGNTLSVGSSGGQIVYRLANPYTVQIDPTPIDSLPALDKTSPRVNTIYTDAENVQVGYAEHPAYTEELINNAILALGGNV